MLLSNKDSFVIFRLPYSQDVFIIKGKWTTNKNSSSGFVISEFKKNSPIFLDGEKKILQNDLVIRNNSDSLSPINTTKEEYFKTAEKFISLCLNKSVNKIILSRIIKEKNSHENIYTVFQELCAKYNHSFNYLLSHPSLGMWMGASPEELITGNSTTFYSTTALAGSKKWSNNVNWGNKEIEEQQYVKKYIEKKLLKLTSESFCDTDLITVKAGNIAHLKSTFKFKTNQPLIKLANAIHPTPAVSGYPVTKAMQNIANYETHSRSLYCGYIGEISNKSAKLFVNLRCLQIKKNNFFIYVGGGLTNLSVAIDEWEETQIKSQTLLSIIKK